MASSSYESMTSRQKHELNVLARKNGYKSGEDAIAVLADRKPRFFRRRGITEVEAGIVIRQFDSRRRGYKSSLPRHARRISYLIPIAWILSAISIWFAIIMWMLIFIVIVMLYYSVRRFFRRR